MLVRLDVAHQAVQLPLRADLARPERSVWYGEYHALHQVTADVGRGEVIAVCGPSGSGKSTLIRTVNRLEEIERGSIFFDGQDIHAKSAPTV